MPRAPRFIPPDSIVHTWNRGNDRRQLFDNSFEYERFLTLVLKAKLIEDLRIIAYALMPNHWHFVLWPASKEQISRFFHRVTCAHAARIRVGSGTIGEGHVYQDRYDHSIVDGEWHYYNVVRYVEANPLAAGLVRRAEHWRWSSLFERMGYSRGLIDAGPFPLLDPWRDFVNQRLTPLEIAAIFERTIEPTHPFRVGRN